MELNKDFVKGTCMQMCSKNETDMRERENLLHRFEVLPGTENSPKPKADKKRMIKAFSRSAAGKNMNVPENVRPPDVLLKTVQFLLTNIVGKKDELWVTIYDFVVDRLRAVRQDLVIQNTPVADVIRILEPIVTFYAFSSYRLCEENSNDFDSHINNVHLQECLKWLLCAYDDLKYPGGCENADKNSSIKLLEENRPYFESLYILFNLGNSLAITRGLNLDKKWKTGLVMLSLAISIAHSSNNFFRVCKLLGNLPLLHSAIVHLQLPELRRKALKIMSVAYNNRRLMIPLNVIEKILLHESIEEARQECEYYGLKVTQTAVYLSKSDFDGTKVTAFPRKSRRIDQQLDGIDISKLLLNNNVLEF